MAERRVLSFLVSQLRTQAVRNAAGVLVRTSGIEDARWYSCVFELLMELTSKASDNPRLAGQRRNEDAVARSVRVGCCGAVHSASQ
jgi:hypothetical protein